jgi:hypothetical protein
MIGEEKTRDEREIEAEQTNLDKLIHSQWSVRIASNTCALTPLQVDFLKIGS